MLIGDVRPTTIDGVKSLARQLRKQQRIKYTTALDMASQKSGCTNFRNAQRKLPIRGSSSASPYVLLTAYWYHKDQSHQVGRETIKVELSRPILEICSRFALKGIRGFGDLRMVAGDHFVCDTLAETQTAARENLCTAQRSLCFMEQTGLRPSRDYRKARPNGSISDKLPDSDHPTYWMDPVNRQFILIDEPYRNVPDEAKRTAWATRTGWTVAKTSWPGMYNPHNCDLYVATDARSGYDLKALIATINGMDMPLIETNWSGDSSSSWETFVSPMAITAQDGRHARCRGTIYPAASATSVPYTYKLGSFRRRPTGKLGVDGHIEAGRIIKAVLRADHGSHGVDTRMGLLRSTLEDWMSFEIGRGELEGPEFFSVYYREAEGDDVYRAKAKSRDGVIKMLKDLRRKLGAAYPDCKSLRQQLRRIDTSITLINRMELASN